MVREGVISIPNHNLLFRNTEAKKSSLPAGAVESGAAFEKAVKAISDKGNQQDLATLKTAGVDVDAVLKGNGGNANAANGKAANGQKAAKGKKAGN
jgi:hypothetical protein